MPNTRIYSYFIYIIFALFFFIKCEQDPSSKKNLDLPPNFKMPDTPEKVVLQWQEWLDKNQYEEAKILSTPNTILWLDHVALIFSRSEDTTQLRTTLKNLKCNITNDTLAICPCERIDEDETIQDTFLLKKQENQWLIEEKEEKDELKKAADEFMKDIDNYYQQQEKKSTPKEL